MLIVSVSFVFHFVFLGMGLGLRQKPLTRGIAGGVFFYLLALHLALGFLFARFPALWDPRI